jgi:orotate phosphoribosyltransferase
VSADFPIQTNYFISLRFMALSAHKLRLIQLMHQAGALQFGAFTLKSGRVSPYFFNARLFNVGPWLEELSGHYARTIRSTAPKATIVFGPAYAGVPLCVGTALSLSTPRKPIGFLFNRKEEKTHGDGGTFVGRSPSHGDRIVIVDDVITDGGTKREAVTMLRGAFPGTPLDALVIAFDRQEQDMQGGNTLARFRQDTGMPIVALLTLDDLIAALTQKRGRRPPAALRNLPQLTEPQQQALLEYRTKYGVQPQGVKNK